jgi:hypothetical protein
MNMPDIVWVVTVRAGRRSRRLGIYTSDDNAMDALAGWCRERWSEQHHHRKRLPRDARGAVDRYFEYWHEMEYDIHFEHLDLGLSAGRKFVRQPPRRRATETGCDNGGV